MIDDLALDLGLCKKIDVLRGTASLPQIIDFLSEDG
jgi:hypothetical protein